MAKKISSAATLFKWLSFGTSHQSVKFENVGSKAWELVAGVWSRGAGGLLAILLVQSPRDTCHNGAVWG